MTDGPGDHCISRRALLITSAVATTAVVARGGTPGYAQSTVATPARWRRLRVDDPATPERVLQSYKKAVRAMLALPASDPRNWYRITLAHTLDCSHANWWLLPWHRAYVGWVERIVRDLSGDPDFAFPYWDWTATPRIPDCMFDDVMDPAHEAFIGSATEFRSRFEKVVDQLPCWKPVFNANGEFDKDSQYGQILERGIRFPADLWFDIEMSPLGKYFYDRRHTRALTRAQPDFDAATKKATSLASILGALAPTDFEDFASARATRHSAKAGFGPLENQPHNMVHSCVGGMFGKDGKGPGPGGFLQANMSPVDPVFFLHHANIDRLWDVWTRKQIAQGRRPLPDGDEVVNQGPVPRHAYDVWAMERFLFFVDEKGRAVEQVTAGSYQDRAFFDYDYQPGSGEQMVGPEVAHDVAKSAYAADLDAGWVGDGKAVRCAVKVPAFLMEACCLDGSRPANLRLAIEFFPHAHGRRLNVYVNPPVDVRDLSVESPFFAGSVFLPCGHHVSGEVSFDLPIGQTLSELGRRGFYRPGTPLRLYILPENSPPDVGISGLDAALCGSGGQVAADIKSVSFRMV